MTIILNALILYQAAARFVMRAPDALYHAQFLASCLQIIKLTMLTTFVMMSDVDRMAYRLHLRYWEHMCIYQVCSLHKYTLLILCDTIYNFVSLIAANHL